jgi:hypothetical protein
LCRLQTWTRSTLAGRGLEYGAHNGRIATMTLGTDDDCAQGKNLLRLAISGRSMQPFS